jgi:RNA polymerase sigma-70 factor (ECF subfamily)
MPDFTEMDDATLADLARTDSDAFAALYSRYLTPLYRYLYRKLGNPRDVEDLTSQVFTELLEGLVGRRYRKQTSIPALLFTIAHHRTVDFYRKRPLEQLDDPPSPEPGLLAAVEKGEDMQRLASLLSRLDEDQQELLRLRFSAGLGFAEIAQVVGRSEAAVKMAVYRTIDQLRDQWEVKNG